MSELFRSFPDHMYSLKIQMGIPGRGLGSLCDPCPGEVTPIQAPDSYERACAAAQLIRDYPYAFSRVVTMGRHSILKGDDQFPEGASEASAIGRVLERRGLQGIPKYEEDLSLTTIGNVAMAVKKGYLDPTADTMFITHSDQLPNVSFSGRMAMPKARIDTFVVPRAARSSCQHDGGEYPYPTMNDIISGGIFRAIIWWRDVKPGRINELLDVEAEVVELLRHPKRIPGKLYHELAATAFGR